MACVNLCGLHFHPDGTTNGHCRSHTYCVAFGNLSRLAEPEPMKVEHSDVTKCQIRARHG